MDSSITLLTPVFRVQSDCNQPPSLLSNIALLHAGSMICPLVALMQAGEFLLVALAYALPAWQHLVLAAACINAATLLLYPLVSETARWLLSQGRTAEAVAILQHTAMRNRTSMPAQPIVSSLQLDSQVDLVCNADAAEEASSKDVDSVGAATGSQVGQPVSWLQVLRQRRLAFRLMVLLLSWFALYLSYYGITVSSGGIPRLHVSPGTAFSAQAVG